MAATAKSFDSAINHINVKHGEGVALAEKLYVQAVQHADDKHDDAIRHMDKSQKYVYDKVSAIEASGRNFTNNRFMACTTHPEHLHELDYPLSSPPTGSGKFPKSYENAITRRLRGLGWRLRD